MRATEDCARGALYATLLCELSFMYIYIHIYVYKILCAAPKRKWHEKRNQPLHIAKAQVNGDRIHLLLSQKF